MELRRTERSHSSFSTKNNGDQEFTSRTLARESAESAALLKANRTVLSALGLDRGVAHTEFIRSRETGEFFFLESGARVGGAKIARLVEAATGVNLWAEWARLEIGDNVAHGPIPLRYERYAGLAITLARQEIPDLSNSDDPEIVWRLKKSHHAGLVVASTDPNRIESLLAGYCERMKVDFHP